MNKVILKTALLTLAVLAFAAALVFSLWILISPQTMASSCEKTGNYAFAVTCADLRYKYTKNVDDLARCAQDSISAKNDSLIVKYGEQLIADGGFEDLCTRKDAIIAGTEYGAYASGYKGYICGSLAAAQYLTGNTDKAVATAEKYASYNKLVIEIYNKKDKDAAGKVLTALDGSDQDLSKLLEQIISQGA